MTEKDQRILAMHEEIKALREQNAAMRELVQDVTRVNSMSEWNLAGLADRARAIVARSEVHGDGERQL